jgi:hypothetical protein
MEGMTQSRSGIPWAEKWPVIRSCRSVAIRILPVVSSGGCRATTGSNLLPVADTTYSRTVRSAPHPPDGRSRTKAPAACWGFRLSLSSENLAGARLSGPPGFVMIALNVLG